jgi:putative flippase GtrA
MNLLVHGSRELVVVLRYVMVSVIAFSLDNFIFFVSAVHFEANILVANILAKTFGFFVSLFGHRYVSFPRSRASQFLPTFVRALLVCLFNAWFSSFLLGIIYSINGALIFSKISADVISFFMTYILGRRFVFVSGTSVKSERQSH